MELSLPNRGGSNFYSLAALVILLAVLVSAIFVVKPMWDEVGSLSLGRDEMAKQRDVLNQKLVDLQQLEQGLNQSTEVSRQTTLEAIPEEFGQDNLILDLQKIAKDNYIVLNGVNFSVPSASSVSKISKASVNASLTGNEEKLVGFLRGVEANARKIVVKSITVQVGKVQDIKRVNFNVNMEVYYQNQN